MRIIKMFDSFQDSNLELNVSEKDAFSKLYLSGLNQTSEWKNDLVDIQIQKIRKINSLNDLSALLGYFQLIGFSPFFEIFDPPPWQLRGIHYLGIKTAKNNYVPEEHDNTGSIIKKIDNDLNSIIKSELSRAQTGRKELIRASKLNKIIPILPPELRSIDRLSLCLLSSCPIFL